MFFLCSLFGFGLSPFTDWKARASTAARGSGLQRAPRFWPLDAKRAGEGRMAETEEHKASENASEDVSEGGFAEAHRSPLVRFERSELINLCAFKRPRHD